VADQIHIGGASRPGAPTPLEDALIADETAGFVVLADATRLRAQGAELARAAAEAAADRIRARGPRDDLAAVMKDAFAAADRAVRRGQSAAPPRGAGVMLLAAVLDGAELHVAHVGVLRAYVLRAAASTAPALPSRSRHTPAIVLPSGARLTCLTADHSAVAGLVESGEITADAASTHPLRGRLTHALGGDSTTTPDHVAIDHARGDRVLLCSDGTWEALGDSPLARLLEKAGSSTAACVAVARAAAGGYAEGGTTVSVIDFPSELQTAAGAPSEAAAPLKRGSPEAILAEIGRDLTGLAREGKLDPMIGREDELRRLGQILLQRKKANALLVGDAGVGKTCIVEGLAQRLLSPSAPRALRGKRIVELSIASLVAGTKFRGEFEERLQSVIQLAAADPELILFIDEFHTIIGAGAGGEALDASNILKPALARGSIRLIGATTTQEYDRHLSRDEALARRFEVIRVEEPTRIEAIAVLQGLRGRFEGHYGLRVSDDALEAAVDLATRYLPERRLPDKAVDLIDQACAQRLLGAFTSATDAELPAETPAASIARRDVATIVAERCRIPFHLVNQGDRERILGLPTFLEERVFGQSAAVARITGMLTKAYGGLKDPRRPIASFLFVGATGVGKTEMARRLAEYLFVRPECLHRFDMTEFGEKHQIARLLGAPPGYVGHEAEGQLTSAVRRRPASVVLLDEIEKAHPDVIMLLLQILDEGELTDGHGKRASFRETILVMTTNVAIDPSRGRPLGFQRGHDASDDGPEGAPDAALREGLRDRFRPELLGRLGAVVSFRPLDAAASKAIAEKTITTVLTRLAAQGGLQTLPPDVRARILEQASTLRFGAREIERLVDAEIGTLVEKVAPTVGA
jgi:ATP-dependent Clp protease ATP-binding subunit ClpC